jgi:hypothetical protein
MAVTRDRGIHAGLTGPCVMNLFLFLLRFTGNRRQE